MFSTLDPSAGTLQRRAMSFAGALSIQVILIASTVIFGVLFPEELPVAERHYALSWIQAMQPPEKPPVTLPREIPRFFVPKVRPPAALELPPPPEVKPVLPKTPPAVASATVHVPAPAPKPAPATSFATLSPPAKAKEQMPVRTGLFGGAPEPVTTRRPLREVQTGGFGSPEGLPGKAMSGSSGNVAKLGSFGLPEGPGVGNGTGGSHGVQGVVASAGFGSGIASMGTSRTGAPVVATAGFGSGVGDSHAGGGEAPKVTTGGFQTATPVAQPKAVQAPSPVQFQPVEILSKPSPVYTEEARQLKIQGEVAVSVVFLASGTIKVLGVVKSLGHGLDQVAVQSASQIRFKPALRDGKPTDFPATLRIQFRLAE